MVFSVQPNSALFEACCNEKIQQFDDSGSDEEVTLLALHKNDIMFVYFCLELAQCVLIDVLYRCNLNTNKSDN